MFDIDVRFKDDTRELLGQFVVEQGDLEIVEILAVVEGTADFEHGAERKHFADVIDPFEPTVHTAYRLHAIVGEPILRLGRFLGVLFVEFGEIVVFVVLLVRDGRRYFGLRRQVDGDVDGRGTAEFTVDDDHALVDFGRRFEIVDETVFDDELRSAADRKKRQQSCARENSHRVAFGKVGHLFRQREPFFKQCVRFGTRKKDVDGRKKQVGDNERDGDADAHHPAQCDDGLDARKHQRGEARNRRDDGEKGRFGHRQCAFEHQKMLGSGRMLDGEFAVTDDQVDDDRDRDDELQRDEIRRNDRHFVAEHSQNPDGDHHRDGRYEYRDHDPAALAENDPKHKNQQREYDASVGFEVAFDEGDHIVGDHRHAAEKQLCMHPVRVHDFSDVAYQLVGLFAGNVAVGFERAFERFHFAALCRGEGTVFIGRTQGVECVEQGVIARIVLQIDLKRGGLEVFAHQVRGIQRVGAKLFGGQGQVGVARTDRRYFCEQFLDRFGRALQQRNIENRRHRGDAFRCVEIVHEGADIVDDDRREQRCVGGVGNDQKVGAAVAFGDEPGVGEILVVFKQKSFGGGIDTQLECLRNQGDGNEQHQGDHEPRIAQNEEAVKTFEHHVLGSRSFCSRASIEPFLSTPANWER